MTKELLTKFLNNKYTSEEQTEIIRWFENDSLFKHGELFIYEEWQSFKQEDKVISEEKINLLLDKIHHKINLKARTNRTQKIGPYVLTWLSRAAAILLIPVLIYLFHTRPSFTFNNLVYGTTDTLEFSASPGSRAFVQLADGTEIHLNFGSTIKYPRNFNGRTREISLSGEGYFKVAPNQEKPFIVKTCCLDIKVLGTQFNVKDYSAGNNVATTLIEGEVTLQRTDEKGNIVILETMAPGEHVCYNGRTGSLLSEIGDIRKYIAWRDGLLLFDNAPVGEIAEQLSRKYNVEFAIDDAIKCYAYTATFTDEQLIQILDYMTMATPIRYRMTPRKQLSDGTLSRQKIILEKNKK